MKKQKPSIFNDVIGPIMRGPSSSHVAAAARIGEIVRQSVNADIKKIVCDFDVNGSLAESHDGHGTDMGFACGILGIPLTDSRVDQYRTIVPENGIDLEYRILDYGVEHPNYYRIEVTSGSGKIVHIDAISTGGGMIDIIKLEGFEISMVGDYFELCIITDESPGELCVVEEFLRKEIKSFEMVSISEKDSKFCINLKTSANLTEENWFLLDGTWHIIDKYYFTPVLPTRAKADTVVPFCSASEMLEYNKDKNLELWELATIYESVRGATTKEAVFEQMSNLVEIMDTRAKTGLAGTEYEDRILHSQSHKIRENESRLVPGSVMNSVIENITAIMEAKSSMNVIIAAPTAGSCGCLPGTLLGVEKSLKTSREETVKGMLAAGLIGVFFAERATFAAEVGGCQVECGAGSGMAAAGVCQMMGGNARECIDAASMALQGLTGLACDPVANRVEVPCLNKNVIGGMNALSCTNMVLAGFDKVIPLDETIDAMYDIGMKLPIELRCTFGGLGKSETSLRIRKDLECISCKGCK